MRAKICYPVHDEQGRVLTWFGRDPQFEEKHAIWKTTDRSEREPEKVHFVRDTIAVWNCSASIGYGSRKFAKRFEAWLPVAGRRPNDAIRLDTFGRAGVRRVQ